MQAAIAQTLRQLPQGIRFRRSYQKTNPADAPILTLALTSTEVPLSALDEYGETTIAQRLSMVGGVAQVLVYGTQKYAVRLQLDPTQLAPRGIALEDIATAVTGQNVNQPTGVHLGPTKTALTVQATGQLDSASAFGDIIVAYRNGAPVHLNEVGQITDDVQNNKTASWYNGERAIVLAIQRQPGTNTVEVAKLIRAALARVSSEIPQSVHVSVLYDRSATIEASVHDVTFTLELTLVLVVMVSFLFLRNMSATVIPSLALPMSIIGTFSVMYLLHYSLDNLSLMALTLAVGFVVDDAIVMLENIVRHLEMGKPKMQAAIDGASEVGFTILSMTFSLAAVFIPFLFMGGIIGKLFHEFAVTIGVAILVSGFVSLTLTPMLSSRFLRSDHGQHHGRMYELTERFYVAWLGGRYERSLAWVMQRRPMALVFSAIILVATAWLFWSTPKGLFPTDDTGHLLATTEAAEGVVRRAGGAAGGRGSGGGARSRCARGDLVGRHHGRGQPGPVDDRPQADRRTSSQRRPDQSRSRRGDRQRGGDHHLHPESAGDLDRRPLVEEPVSIHVAERRHRRTRFGGVQAAGAPPAAADPDRRDQ